MSLHTLLTTPAPPHSFLFGRTRLAYGLLNHRRNSLQRVEQVPLDEGWFRLGPVGILQVDRQPVATALSSLGQRLGKLPSRASAVIPNEWVRTVLVEAEGLPRQRLEAEDVVRWRLKKLLPCRPEEVRLDFVPAGDGSRVLVMLALDKPLATLEESFSAAGLSLGRIEPMALALATLVPPGDGQRLLVMLEPGTVGLVLVGRDGEPSLVRHKVLLGNATQADAFLVRELSRTLAHARESGDGATPLEVILLGTVDALAETVTGWAAGEQSVVVRQLAIEGGPWPAAPEVNPVHLAALLAAAAGGEG